jgi:glycosyltransferase involved in cell wall biosynthesis
MRIAIFTDNDFGKINGVTTTLTAVLRWRPSDLDLRVYTAADVGVERPDYLALRSFGVGIPFYSEMKMYIPRFFAFLNRAKADGIQLVHYTTPGPVGLAAMYVASKLQVPMVGSFHTQLSEYTALLSGSERLGNLMREYQRWPYGKCERILVPSTATRDLLIAAKIRAEKIRLWTRGVDTDQFTPARRSAAMRDAWGVNDARPALIYVGRLSREKGLDAVPAIARTLREAGVDHRLVFVGDGPMRQTLPQACPDAIFTGALPHAEVATAMASADVFVFPSRTDTLGNVVLEAQACGLPVLVSDAGGPRENILEGESGFVCAPGGALDMPVRALQLASDRTRRVAMGAAARAYACGRSWATAMAPLYDSYREVGRDVDGEPVIPNVIGRTAELEQSPLHTGHAVATTIGHSPEGLRKL